MNKEFKDTKTINVHLLEGGLPYYRSLVNYPPDGIKYVSKESNVSEHYNSVKYNLKRRLVSFSLTKFKIPPMLYVRNDQSDIIHSRGGILILNSKPWVMDIDYVGYFFGENVSNKKILKSSYLKWIVEKFLSSDHCKGIICWSNAAKASIINVFGKNSIKNKIEVVYPAVMPFKSKIKRDKDKIKILYVSSSFGPKGGKELLSAFEILLKKYDNIELIFKCDVPEEIKAKFNFKEIHYFPYRSQILTQNELIETFFMNADIFAYPTYGDLFGLGLLDAMVAGLPIVSTSTFAIPEIVEDWKNGLLIDHLSNWHDENYLPIPSPKNIKYSEKKTAEFTQNLVDKLSLLIEDASLRGKMGKNSRKLVETGKFSINQRNRKLKKIYEEALKR